MNLIRKKIRLKAFDTVGDRSFFATISSVRVDRAGDVMLPEGIRYADFKKNPVMLVNHDSENKPIGKWSDIRKERGRVTAIGTIAERPQPLADDTLYLVQNGFINAVSISFTVPDGGARKATTKDIRDFGPEVQRVITNWDLVEVSLVSTPANPEALIERANLGDEKALACCKSFGVQLNHRRLVLSNVLRLRRVIAL